MLGNRFLIFIIIFILSAQDTKEEHEEKKEKLFVRELFQLKNLKEGFASLVKKRDYHRRTFLILLVLVNLFKFYNG